MSYRPLYAMYSSPPAGWRDEPFDYCFNFQFTFTPTGVTNPRLADLFNTPLALEGDADFYVRGMAIQIDLPPSTYAGGGRIDFDMRLRDPFGRPLDDGFVPFQIYATSPRGTAGGIPGAWFASPGAPAATPWYPELYCPQGSVLLLDLRAQGASGGFFKTYSFHMYFTGVKRIPNEVCK
jgi:hypothetical protein